MLYDDYLAKSSESLKSARILFEAECYNSCISRCYYAMFQIAVSALIKLGIKPPKAGEYGHAWVQAAVAQELIQRRKLLPSRMASLLPDMLKLRNEADYEVVGFGRKVTGRTLAKADEFIKKIRDLLQ